MHIGELITLKLKEKDLPEAWLARKIGMDPSNFHKKLKKKSIDTDLLQDISNVLDCTFFLYYIADKKT